MFKKYLFPIVKIICVLLLFKLFSGIIGRLLNIVATGMFHYELADIGFYIGDLITALILVYITHRKGIKLFTLENWNKNLLRGSIEGFTFAFGGILLLIIFDMVKIDGFNSSGFLGILGSIFFGIIKAMFLVALPQELLLRGFVFKHFRSRFTMAGTILIISFLYSLSFRYIAYSSYLFVLNMFLLGIVLYLVMLKSSSIFSSIGFSFGIYLVLDALFSLTRTSSKIPGLLNTSYKKYDLITGGSLGIHSGLFFTILILGCLVYVMLKNSYSKEFFIGLKRVRNIIILIIPFLFATIHVYLDIRAWTPENLYTDNSTQIVINEYQNVNNYTMTLNLDTKNKKLYGNQELEYINTANVPLNEIYLHIYPNAFSKYGGGIDFNSISLNDKNAEFKIEGNDKTLLYIPLLNPVMPGERVDISMVYTINIPKSSKDGFARRFAYGEDTFNLGNFFPIAAVYGKDGWDKHPYDEKGDAFFSETSNFHVFIQAPKKYNIASSGVLENKLKNKNNFMWQIRANSVRDFTFVASCAFEVAEGMVDGTLVKSYAFSKVKAKYALSIGQASLIIFNKKFGKYPYPTLNIVETDIDGGMEYPNLVMIGKDYYRNLNFNDFKPTLYYGMFNGSLKEVIAHEIAHQWWYSLVGNDEFSEAWVDEPMACFSELIYFKNAYGEEAFKTVYDNIDAYQATNLRYYNSSIKHVIRRPLNEFTSNEYYSLVYNKGILMFYDLYLTLGEEKFTLFQQTLFDRYKYKVLTGDELITTASEIAGEDMNYFFDMWLNTDYMGENILYPIWLQNI